MYLMGKYMKYFQILDHVDFDLLTLLIGAFVCTAILFLYCFYGKLATDSFGSMAVCMFESNWQDLPVDLQKYFILVIGNAQRPLFYHGSGLAVLNLETFTKVLTSFYQKC